MRIAATCDIHYDLLSSPQMQNEFTSFLQAIKAERPDVLVIADSGFRLLDDGPEIMEVPSGRSRRFRNA